MTEDNVMTEDKLKQVLSDLEEIAKMKEEAKTCDLARLKEITARVQEIGERSPISGYSKKGYSKKVQYYEDVINHLEYMNFPDYAIFYDAKALAQKVAKCIYISMERESTWMCALRIFGHAVTAIGEPLIVALVPRLRQLVNQWRASCEYNHQEQAHASTPEIAARIGHHRIDARARCADELDALLVAGCPWNEAPKEW